MSSQYSAVARTINGNVRWSISARRTTSPYSKIADKGANAITAVGMELMMIEVVAHRVAHNLDAKGCVMLWLLHKSWSASD